MGNNIADETGEMRSQESQKEAELPQEPNMKSPWNPSVFYALAVLCGFGAAGVLAGINYRRLGKPALIWPTISISVLTFVAVTVGIMATADVVGLFWWACIVNLLAAFVLERLQRPHYKRWKERATIAKGAGWGVPVVVGLGGIAAFAIAACVAIVTGLVEENYTRRILEAGITPIVIGQEITGTIDSDDYWDVFSFQAEQGKCYVIETGTPSTSTPLKNSFLTLWRPNPLLPLTENNNYGGSLNSRIEWTAEGTGILYVTVENGDTVSSRDYTLLIQCVSR